jgi:tyrosyl-tRNA synthetase
VNDAAVHDERMRLDETFLSPQGVIKLSVGRKKHALLRAAS